MPQSGGTSATVVVTIGLDQLRADLAAASLDTGGHVSAGEVRRLACSAGIIPAVLGGASVPLDLGRRRRLHTPHQRIALGLARDTCAATGCERPSAWCETHHLTAWSRGGGTSVQDAALLCSWHHHRAHDPSYAWERLPDGTIRFHRRP